MFYISLAFLLLSSCISIHASESPGLNLAARSLMPVNCPPGNPEEYIAIIDACYSSQADYHSRLTSGTCIDRNRDHAGAVISAYREAGGKKKVWLLTYFYKNANTEDTMANGLGAVLRCGVKTVNISGGGYVKSTEESELIAKMVQNNFKIYAAAGNNALDLERHPFYPAAYPGVIAVGGNVCVGNHRKNKSNFGRIVARRECDHVYHRGEFYIGTSFAAPRAAGKDEL
jgi:hypothetical protein